MDKYERYRLLWMLAHGYSIKDLIRELTEKQYADPEDSDYISNGIDNIFADWEYDTGFGGEIWACREEWERCEANEAMD